MKKLINNPENVVGEELEGMAIAHPDLIKVHYDPNYVVRVDAPVIMPLVGGVLGALTYDWFVTPAVVAKAAVTTSKAD